MTETEFRLELAIWLYQQGRITLALAIRWAGLTRPQFQRELNQRGIPIHYTPEDLCEELQKQRGLIEAVRPLMEQLPQKAGFCISEGLFHELLLQMGELRKGILSFVQTGAWQFLPDGTLEWQTFELPDLAAGEVQVHLLACGLCSGEVMDWYMRRKAPLVPGHELVGEIEAVGAKVEGFQVGDRVVVHHHAPCGKCPACQRGAYVHCPTWRSTKLVPGGLSERFVVPAPIVQRDLLRLAATLSDERAVFTEPLACVVKSLRRAGLRHGMSLAVIGLGVMGMLHILLAQAWGAKHILGLDRLPHRLEFARTLGAVAVAANEPSEAVQQVRDLMGGDGAEIVVIGPGTTDALELGMQLVAPDGVVILFTPAPPEVRYPLDWHTLYFREVRLVPSYSAGPGEMRHALRLLEMGLPVEKLITHRLPLSRVPEGYALLRRAEALKVILQPESSAAI
jgi:L-iditol 2-dehydrogenase